MGRRRRHAGRQWTPRPPLGGQSLACVGRRRPIRGTLASSPFDPVPPMIRVGAGWEASIRPIFSSIPQPGSPSGPMMGFLVFVVALDLSARRERVLPKLPETLSASDWFDLCEAHESAARRRRKTKKTNSVPPSLKTKKTNSVPPSLLALTLPSSKKQAHRGAGRLIGRVAGQPPASGFQEAPSGRAGSRSCCPSRRLRRCAELRTCANRQRRGARHR